MLPALIGATSVAWIAVLLARPRRPNGLDDAPWLVYSRYCGVRERMMLFAVILTLGTLLTGIVGIHHAVSAQVSERVTSCNDTTPGKPPTCYVFNADRSWSVVQQDQSAGGKWRIVATVPPTQYPYR